MCEDLPANKINIHHCKASLCSIHTATCCCSKIFFLKRFGVKIIRMNFMFVMIVFLQLSAYRCSPAWKEGKFSVPVFSTYNFFLCSNHLVTFAMSLDEIYYHPAKKLWEGNVFRNVCLSVSVCPWTTPI